MENNEKMINAENIDLFNSPDFVDFCMVEKVYPIKAILYIRVILPVFVIRCVNLSNNIH